MHDESGHQNWDRVQELFGQMLEADDPLKVLEAVSDADLSAATALLWQQHKKAELAQFLDNPITLVRDLMAAPDEAVFSTGQKLASRFVVLGARGAGGMGEVYLALDEWLNERVAIKTIRRSLASDEGIRARFIAEVQSARKVTHPNVCRIFDLFAEGDTPFFAMEYLEGERLPDWKSGSSPAEARRVALQLAEGLHAAHRSGIIHCDFKPANVVVVENPSGSRAVITDFGLARAFRGEATRNEQSLQAGTLDYMAPELLAGRAATVRSDIYAFGKVLEQMIGTDKVVQDCQAEKPENRPESLEPVIRHLQGGIDRRLVMAGLCVLGLGAATGYAGLSRPALALGTRQRLALNGLRSDDSHRGTVFRNLLIAALRQSPLLAIVPDERLVALLKLQKPSAQLPAEREDLLRAALREGVPLVLDGQLKAAGSALHFAAEIWHSGDKVPVLQLGEQVDSVRDVLRLAEKMAMRLRWEFGESSALLNDGRASLERITSRFPEAVDAYYRGVSEYERANSSAALAWFDQALQTDDSFAMAHLYRGMTLATQSRVLTAIPCYERAFSLRNKLSRREQLWIESRYYNIVGDYVSSLEACKKLIVYFPDEATFHRHKAFAHARTGQIRHALPHNRKAVELNPFSDNNVSELIANHAQANLCDEALGIYGQFRAEGRSTTLFEWGAGLAYMGRGEHDKALLAFDRMAATANRERWSRLLRCGPLIVMGRFNEALTALASDLAYDTATGDQTDKDTRTSWLGSLSWLSDRPGDAGAWTEQLCALAPSPGNLQPLREGGLLANSLRLNTLCERAVNSLRQIERRWPSTRSKGARIHLEAVLLETGDEPAALKAYQEALGLLPDPLTLLSIADSQKRRADYQGQLDTLEALEQQQGTIFRYYFPGLAVLGWIETGRCLKTMSRFAEARRFYDRALQVWGGVNCGLVRSVRKEYRELNSSFSGGRNG
ncbi:MAG: protein kinase [Bryobacteraceae bacterium]|nr:protein kinase [Bryobacteraceae bacterium]